MRTETAIHLNTTTPNTNSNIMMSGSKPTFLTKTTTNNTNNTKILQFLIMDAPRPNNLHQYIKEFKKHNVTDVVRVCEPTYSVIDLNKAGIALHEMPYPDGHSPPDDVLDRWLKLVDERFIHPIHGSGGGSSSSSTNSHVSGVSTAANGTNGTIHNNNNNNNNNGPKKSACPTIAVHCVAGLGRAPVLVAIALIEFCKMEPVDAATFIRKHRRGAINNTQLDWLERYKRRYKSAATSGCCIVM